MTVIQLLLIFEKLFNWNIQFCVMSIMLNLFIFFHWPAQESLEFSWLKLPSTCLLINNSIGVFPIFSSKYSQYHFAMTNIFLQKKKKPSWWVESKKDAEIVMVSYILLNIFQVYEMEYSVLIGFLFPSIVWTGKNTQVVLIQLKITAAKLINIIHRWQDD